MNMTKHRVKWKILEAEIRHSIELVHSKTLTPDQALLLIERSIYNHAGPSNLPVLDAITKKRST